MRPMPRPGFDCHPGNYPTPPQNRQITPDYLPGSNVITRVLKAGRELEEDVTEERTQRAGFKDGGRGRGKRNAGSF